MSEALASRLRWWRSRRGVSQLDLAGRAGVSQRHLSFLEIGRTAPSREMVLRLANALELPLRQQNELLRAAGFAAIWRETSLRAPELAMINRALEFMLAQQEPYPAVVVDRRWNMLRANGGAKRLIGFLTGTNVEEIDPDLPINLADALVAPDALRSLLLNWREVAAYFVRGMQADAIADGTKETRSLLDRLLGHPDVPELLRSAPVEQTPTPVLSMEFAKDGWKLRLFTTIATLGTPQDITLQEIRVESFFPADSDTERLLRSW
jgi:transcriptional regulator with XRE-family HTH domain